MSHRRKFQFQYSSPVIADLQWSVQWSMQSVVKSSLRQGRKYKMLQSHPPFLTNLKLILRNRMLKDCSTTLRRINQITKGLACHGNSLLSFSFLPRIPQDNHHISTTFSSHSHAVTCSCPPHPSHCMPVIVPIDVAMKLRCLC